MRLRNTPVPRCPGCVRRACATRHATQRPRASADDGTDAPPPPRAPILADVARASGATAGLLTAAAITLRTFAPPIAGLLPGSDAGVAASLLALTPSLDTASLAAAAPTAAAVTAARAAVLAASPSYRAESDASLALLLPTLGIGGVALWLCVVPAAAEEALFRGALLPLLAPDWRGVVGVASLFGVLHASGGRGAPSAAFATGAGAAYGWLFLACGGNLAAPVLAHALANGAAAGLWWARQQREKGGEA